MNSQYVLWLSKQITQRALDTIFPPVCVNCKKSGSVLCSSCLLTIPLLQPPFCLHCSSTYIENGLCKACQYHPLQLSGVRTASHYQEPLRSCIHALKYEGKASVAEQLGVLLSHMFISHKMQADVIIPMPLHRQRIAERGYNQSQLLAEVCAKRLGLPVRTDIVIRHRATEAQVGLTAAQRQQNVAGAFRCEPAFTTSALVGRTIVIVDDVCTTGSTLEACARPLFDAGAASVWGLVLARPA